jgi:uncharacterized protein YkwD
VHATPVFATKSLVTIIQYLTGEVLREPLVSQQINPQEFLSDMDEARRRERVKRALGIAPNSDLTDDAKDHQIQMDKHAKTYVEQDATKLNLTAR